MCNKLPTLLSQGDIVEKDITCNKLALAYKKSSQFSEIGSELSPILDQAVKSHKQYAQFSTSFSWQVYSFMLYHSM